jgi:hypothetical protein
MTRDQAAERYPEAEPDLGTVEVRNLPENMDEWNVARRDRSE